MTALRFTAAALAALLASPLAAADDPLDAIPAEAGVLVRLSPPSELGDSVKAFARTSAPPFVPLADQLGPSLGSVIGNPTLAGVDAGRDWYVAVFPQAERKPAVVFAAPAKDAAALKAAVGQGYTFADFQDWVLYSLDAEAVGAVRDRVVEGEPAEPSIRAAFDDRTRAIFADGEVAAFVNVPVLRTAYRAQIDAAKAQLDRFVTNPPGGEANPQIKASMEFNRRAAEVLLRGLEDSTGLATSVAIGEKAVASETLAVFAADSPSAKAVVGQPASEFDLLARLPADRLVYFGLSGEMSGLIAESTRLTGALVPPEKAEELAKVADELESLRFGQFVGSFGLGDVKGGVLRGEQLVQIDDANRYREVARKMVAALGHVETPGLQQDYSLEPDAETVGGLKVDRLKVTMTADPNTDPSGFAQKFVTALFGPDGLTQWMTVADGLFVQVVGDKQDLESALSTIRARGDAAAARPDARAAIRSELSGKANGLFLIDFARLVAEGAKLVAEGGNVPVPIDRQAIDGLGLKPSYAGGTVVGEDAAVRVRGVLPAEQVRGVVGLVGILQQPGRR